MKLCLGTVQFGMDYGVQGAHKKSYREIDTIIEWAFLHGITSFDTAAVYGEAEDVLGHYIRHRYKGHVEQPHIVSKLAAGILEITPEDQWSDTIKNRAKRSLATLGVPKLSAYLFHDASCIYNTHAVEALYTVKKENLSESVGVSVYTPEEAMKATEYNEITAIQIPYNVLDHRLDKIGFFQRAKERNISVYARSTLLQGLLMMQPQELPEHMRFAESVVATFLELCHKYNTSPLEAAVGYVKEHRAIDYLVFGVDSKKQLKDYVGIQKKTISPNLINDLREAFWNVDEKVINPTLWKVRS